jgi:hypothetical protein
VLGLLGEENLLERGELEEEEGTAILLAFFDSI